MRPPKQIVKRIVLPATLAVALMGATDFIGRGQGVGSGAPSGKSGVILTFGPGGVLTGDGALWVYRPDKGVWITIDDSFAEEGRTTHVVPLPVPVAQIAQMQSFGFIVTSSGTCWLYDLEKDRWKDIGVPPRLD